jgi:hypothetical protein
MLLEVFYYGVGGFGDAIQSHGQRAQAPYQQPGIER